MAWTTPKTDWTIGERVAASDMNALAHFDAVMVRGSSDAESCLDVTVGGVRIGGNQGLAPARVEDEGISQSFTRAIQNLGAGSHSFKLHWKDPNYLRLYAGAPC